MNLQVGTEVVVYEGRKGINTKNQIGGRRARVVDRTQHETQGDDLIFLMFRRDDRPYFFDWARESDVKPI